MDALEFQKAQKAKVLACYGETPESIIAKAEENDLEKVGEGSKGGKIIGHTKSGKPIYDIANHESHSKFTKEERIEKEDKKRKLFDKGIWLSENTTEEQTIDLFDNLDISSINKQSQLQIEDDE